MFFKQMHPTWQNWLVASEPELLAIEQKVLGSGDSLPPKELVMRAFQADPQNIKVVLLGQDPYPTPGDGIGLAFAVNAETKTPRSLKNIMTELASDGFRADSADLAQWSNKGVLLLNTSLTTAPGKAGSHSKLGWNAFTLEALKVLALQQDYVLLAWGNHAKQVSKSLPSNIRVVDSAHPSPLSANRGFFGSKPFSRANQALIALGLEPIDWSL